MDNVREETISHPIMMRYGIFLDNAGSKILLVAHPLLLSCGISILKQPQD